MTLHVKTLWKKKPKPTENSKIPESLLVQWTLIFMSSSQRIYKNIIMKIFIIGFIFRNLLTGSISGLKNCVQGLLHLKLFPKLDFRVQ